MHVGLARFKSELLQCNHSDLKRACGVKGGGGLHVVKVIEAVAEVARACLKRKKKLAQAGCVTRHGPPLTF